MTKKKTKKSKPAPELWNIGEISDEFSSYLDQMDEQIEKEVNRHVLAAMKEIIKDAQISFMDGGDGRPIISIFFCESDIFQDGVYFDESVELEFDIEKEAAAAVDGRFVDTDELLNAASALRRAADILENGAKARKA